ncbi:MAG: CapA family protein [Thiotrichales bacterium]|nr:MAG: CapA family protein [Thiotrichales bacterium]
MRTEPAINEPTPVVLFLSGDVMLGRAIDQILPHHNEPVLFEDYIKDARDYIRIAEEVSGPIPRPVSCDYIWGDALTHLNAIDPDVSIINLETSVTRSDTPWPKKYIHYRMHPENVACIASANIDIALLANNHVLDWGYRGLAETLFTLDQAGIGTAGAGNNLNAAIRPAIIEIGDRGRVLVYAWAHASSGVPQAWAALADRPGVNRLDYLNTRTVQRINDSISPIRKPGDIVVASIHWGGNWGYDVPSWQTEFAHRLIDHANVDVVHGHSSHHVKGIEVYKGRLIIYGSGDLLNDYEGIGGHEEYRADLSLMYFASIDPNTGDLVKLQMIPTQIRKLRINQASDEDAEWMKDRLNREGRRFNTQVKLEQNNRLILGWQ